MRKQIFQKSWNHHKILCAKTVTWSKFHSEDRQTQGVTAQNLVVWDLCAPDWQDFHASKTIQKEINFSPHAKEGIP